MDFWIEIIISLHIDRIDMDTAKYNDIILILASRKLVLLKTKPRKNQSSRFNASKIVSASARLIPGTA